MAFASGKLIGFCRTGERAIEAITVQAVVDSVYCNEENFPALGNETGSFYELTQDYAVSILKADETKEHYPLSRVLNYYADYNDSDLKFYHEYYRSNHKGISRYTTDPDLLNQMIDEFIESVMVHRAVDCAPDRGKTFINIPVPVCNLGVSTRIMIFRVIRH